MIPTKSVHTPARFLAYACVVCALIPFRTVGAEGAVPITDKTFRIEPGADTSVLFELPSDLGDGRPQLTLHARLESPTVAGNAASLRISLNDVNLDARFTVNRPRRAQSRSGAVYSLVAGDRWAAWYAPDFQSPKEHPHYGLVNGPDPCTFVFDVGDIMRPGENTLVLSNTLATGAGYDLIVADVALMSATPSVDQSVAKETISGPLPLYEVAPHAPPSLSVESPGAGQLTVALGSHTHTVDSQYSTPDGNWAAGTTNWFSHERTTEPVGNAIVVTDTFVNRTDTPMPIMQRHTIALAQPASAVYVCGLDQPDKEGAANEPENPTVFAAVDADGIGLIALSDALRIHSEAYGSEGTIRLSDNQCVLPPNGAYTARWAIIPTAAPSYWSFINEARRLIGANFTIEGGFAFLRGGPLTEAWSDKQISDFLTYKDPLWVCATISPAYNGHYTHGTAFQRVGREDYAEVVQRWKRLAPAVKSMVYFHCFLDVVEDGPELFADARLLMSDGSQGDYGEPVMKLYIPTETNSFGPAVEKNVDLILDEIGADGVYWDEHEYSRYLYHFGEPWDRISGDIDATTHQLIRTKSSVTLLSEAWRVALAKRILAHGPLVGNGAPFTEATRALGFPCFVETGSISNCVRAHLHTPIALGDHLTEQNEVDAYYTMRAALDYGCVYHWYNDMTVVPTHPHMTQYMFPITPIELHEGYIIGEERIVTNRSGIYGWRDASTHEIHIFDDTGRETHNIPVESAVTDAIRRTTLRLPENYSAVIVRGPADSE